MIQQIDRLLRLIRGAKYEITGGLIVLALVWFLRSGHKLFWSVIQWLARKIVGAETLRSEPRPILTPNIPPDHVGFVARKDKRGEELLAQLIQPLGPEKNEFVVLWGEGGVGKTTLAKEAARALREKYGKRIVISSAEKQTRYTFASLLDDIAVHFNRDDIQRLGPREKAKAVEELIKEAPTLIILDNLETVSSTERKKCEDFLHRRSPFSTLVTTRDDPGFGASIKVEGMQPDEAMLFLERLTARLDRNVFTPKTLRRIYEEARHIPLVMEWLVGQIKKTRRLDDVFSELRRGKGEAAERIFNRSFDLPQLTNDGRTVVLTLALFPADASREAIAAVAGFGDDASRLDTALQCASELLLIKASDTNEHFFVEGLTKELALNRLEHPPPDTKPTGRLGAFRARLQGSAKPMPAAETLKRNFVSYFVQYAQRHGVRRNAAYDLLELEHVNLEKAIDTALTLNDYLDAISICFAVDDFWDTRGYWDERVNYNRLVARKAREAGDENKFWRLEYNAVQAFLKRGEHIESKQSLQQGLGYFKKSGDKLRAAKHLIVIGRIALNAGDLSDADSSYEHANEMFEAVVDHTELEAQIIYAQILGAKASLLAIRNEYPEAIRLYQEQLAINEKLNDKGGCAEAKRSLGIIAENQGDYEKAMDYYTQALSLYRKLDDKNGRALLSHDIGDFAKNQGRYEEAQVHFTEAEALYAKLGYKGGIARLKHSRGMIAQSQGNYGKAGEFYDQALALYNNVEDKRWVASVICALGSLRQYQGDFGKARDFHDQALITYRELDDKSGQAVVMSHLGIMCRFQGQIHDARNYFTESYKIAEKIEFKWAIATVQTELGILALLEKDYQGAEDYLQKGLRGMRTLKIKADEAKCLESLGNLRTAQATPDEAENYLRQALAIAEELGDKFRIGSARYSFGLLLKAGQTHYKVMRNKALMGC